MTKDVISLSISVLLLFKHYISHKITFGAPSSGGVLCSACGAFINSNKLSKVRQVSNEILVLNNFWYQYHMRITKADSSLCKCAVFLWPWQLVHGKEGRP